MVSHWSSVFSFSDSKLSKYQWIFTKLRMCIDFVGIWFGIANGQISSISDRVICPPDDSGFLFFFSFLFFFPQRK